MTHNNKETGMQKTIFVPAYRKLVQELRRARRNAGLTQEEVGRRMGRSRQFIHGWETYESRMDAVQICRFARVCGVKAHILVRLMEEELSEEDDSFYLSDVVLRQIPLGFSGDVRVSFSVMLLSETGADLSIVMMRNSLMWHKLSTLWNEIV